VDGVGNGDSFVVVAAVLKGFPILTTQRTFHCLVHSVPSANTNFSKLRKKQKLQNLDKRLLPLIE